MAAPALTKKRPLVMASCLRDMFGIDSSTLARLRAAGVIPPPLPGTRRYDLEAVKKALDNRGGSGIQIASDEDDLIKRANAL